jgi:hypothetical protein
MSDILYLIEPRIHHASANVHKFINSSKYSYISIHDGHGLMMMYDIHMHCRGHEKLQEKELNQGHIKENKSQEMQT